jgi:hypothetical protein
MNQLYSTLFSFLLYFFVSNLSAQTLCFDPANDNRYETQETCMDVGVLDINNDGHLDVIAAGGSETSIHVGNGDGTFQPFYTSAPGTNWDIEFVDFDNDGDLDFYSYGFGNTVAGRNLGNGNFEWAGYIGVTLNNDQFSEMSIGNDILGNGGYDIVFNDRGGDVVFIVDCDAAGVPVSTTTLATIDNPGNVKVGDLNGDDHDDIVVSSGIEDNTGIYLSNGNGTFDEIIEYAGPVVGSGYGTIEIADIDGDNDNDILIAGLTVAYILENQGNGNFSSLPDVFMGSYCQGFITGDWDGDDDLDFAWANQTNGGVTINLNNGDGTFPTLGNAFYSSGNQSEELVAGDFDEDGIVDLVVANGFFNNFAFLKGHGDGRFGSLALLTNYGASGFCSADFDNDGDVDMMGLNSYTPCALALSRNNGDGSFMETEFTATANNSEVCAAGDFNEDGNVDVAVHSSQGFHIHFGNGDGTFDEFITFESANIGAGGERTICTGDFNGDGNLDLAGSRIAADNVALVYGNGAGSFSAPIVYTDGIQYARTIIAAHLNSDSYEDLVITSNSTDQVFVYFGTSTQDLSEPLIFNTPGAPEGLAAFDANEDGANDILVVSPNANKLFVFAGNNDQTFDAAVEFDTPTGSNPTKGTHADINNDTHQDFICAFYQANAVGVFFGDGAGNFLPAISFDVDRRPINVLTADFNLDGASDFASLNSSVNNMSVVLNNSAFVSSDGPLAFCVGEDVVLTASEGYSYEWNNGAESQSITVSDPGEYYCAVTNQSGSCTLITSSVLVEVYQGQTVTLDLDSTLVCSNAGSFFLSGGSPFGGQFSGTGVVANQFNPATAGPGTYVITYQYEDAGSCTNASATDEITVELCIGVSELENDVSIYPTNTTGIVNIICPMHSQVVLYESSGKIVKQQTLFNSNNTIDLSEFSDGIYLLKINNEDREVISKIVIRK